MTSVDARLLVQSELWIAEDLSSWSHAHTTQKVDGRDFTLRVAFYRHEDHCRAVLSIFGPLEIPAPPRPKRVPITSTWNVDDKSEVIFGVLDLANQSTDSHPGAVSISVMPGGDGKVILAAMLTGSQLNVKVENRVLTFALDGAAAAIDAALEVSEKGEQSTNTKPGPTRQSH